MALPIWNTRVSVVHNISADSKDAAVSALVDALKRAGFEAYDGDDAHDAFEAEPGTAAATLPDVPMRPGSAYEDRYISAEKASACQPDVIGILIAAAGDSAGIVTDAAINAGLLWVCPNCDWYNPMTDDACQSGDGCTGTRDAFGD